MSALLRLVPTLGPIGGTTVRQPEGIAGETRAPAGLEPLQVKKKWGRWHHEVDYSPFRGNAVIQSSNSPEVFDESDDFGLRLIDVVPNRRRAARPSQRQQRLEL